MDTERDKKLRQLAKLMNQQNVTSIPVTKRLIDCFDLVIDPDENEFLLKMGTAPFSFDQGLDTSGLSKENFSQFFDAMLRKGIVWPEYQEDGSEKFKLAPILLGWFEIFLSSGDESEDKVEFSRRVEKLFQSWGKLNVFPIRGLWNIKHKKGQAHKQIYSADKTGAEKIRVQLNQKIDAADTQIFTTKGVFELIEKYGDLNEIAVVHCFCRQWHKMIDDPCRFNYPDQSCVVIGKFSRHVVDYGIGRLISKEEAFELMLELQKSGAVHQVYHDREDINQAEIAICNCCWDCCGVLGSYNRGNLPLHFISHYLAEIEFPQNCTGCGRCVRFCPVNALKLKDKTITLDEKKCIGCGQCELKCKEDVFKLISQKRDVVLPLLKKSQARLSNKQV